MCGILGLITTGPQAESGIALSHPQIEQALLLTQHRGPNHSQLAFIYPDRPAITRSFPFSAEPVPPAPVVLGHNRLSILDPSPAAHQPMSLEQRMWLTYNGEIYNAQELRKNRLHPTTHLHSQSDTEVLLHLLAQYGPTCLNHLNGMFAIAFWDPDQQQLTLARDRYGIKPLYYTWLPNGTFAFASEIKSLLQLGCARDLDYQALSEHLTFQNTFGPKTLLKSVQVLEPGTYATLNARTGHFELTRYWEPVFNSTPPANGAIELRLLLEEAVQKQLIGDVPIGSFLSGGIDSGIIAALASQKLPGLPTFTCGFDLSGISGDEQSFDERSAARDLANLLKTRHYESILDAHTLPEILPQVVWHLDDFRAGISYQNFMANHLARPHATVVLSGVGGDELFAGYPWRYEPLLHLKPADFTQAYYQSWVRLLSDTEKQALFSPAINQALNGFSTEDRFKSVLSTCQAEHPLHQALCFDVKTFLHGLLMVEDRLSMAHGIEARVPFLDNQVVDFALQLPPDAQLQPGQSKKILKEAFGHLLPPALLQRPKQGFTPPDASWYRGQNRHYIESLLLSPQALERGLFKPSQLKAILEAHACNGRNHRHLIWSLLCLEWWHRLFVDASNLQAPEPQLTEAHAV